MCHIDAKDLIIAVCVRPPDVAYNVVIGQDLTRIFRKQGNQLILDLGQMDLMFVQCDQSFGKINDQAVAAVWGGNDRSIHGADGRSSMAQGSADSG